MELTAKQIQQNYKTFRQLITEISPSRLNELENMYDDLGEERVMFAPASGYDYFHNAFPGGYIDHVLRVYEFTLEQYEMWKRMGMKTNNFTLEELSFAAIHHDLGKLGLPGLGKEHYQHNDSKWHRENQGKMYKSNPNVPHVPITDKGFFLLNHYGVKYSLNEMIGIRCTDGMYEETNKAYLSGFNLDSKLRNSMPYILHHADIMAFRFEFERWAESSGKFALNGEVIKSTTKSIESKKQISTVSDQKADLAAFNKLFGND